MKRSTFHARHELDQARISNVEDEAIDYFVTKIAMGHLAALETQRCLYLVAFTEEADGLVLLRLIVMLVDSNREFYFLDDDYLLLLAGGAFALVFLIQELAVVLDLADRRDGVRGDLYKIERLFAGHLERVEGRHDAKLLAVFVDDADLTGTDTLISADKGFCGTLINQWNRSPPQRAIRPPCVCLDLGAPSWVAPHSKV